MGESMLHKILFITVLSALTTTVSAAVNLIAPEEIVVVAIDDQQLSPGVLRAKQNQLTLDAGVHQIAVKYQDIYFHQNGDHDVLKSNIVSLNQVALQDGQSYRLLLLNPPQDFEQAKRFAETPSIAIQNQAGQLIAQQTGASSHNKNWLNHTLFAQQTDLRQPMPTQHLPNDAATQSIPASNLYLIEQWQKATPEQRRALTAWLADRAQ
jgi:uncharacterized protein YccT (UPF0319 family)